MHPNLKLLSHSSDNLLDLCGRKYEIYKLSPNTWKSELQAISNHEELSNLPGKEVHLDFGSIVGIGTQEYLLSGSTNAAIMAMFLAWENNIEDEAGEKDKKTFWHSLYALDKFIGLRHTHLANYELATFAGKPAIELGYIIDCGNGFTYRGFLDALLVDRKRRELIPYEGKTTGAYTVHEAMFKNSGQALGYSLVVDTIARQMGLEYSSSFRVLYNVYKTKTYEWEHAFYPKTFLQRALWIKSLLYRIQRIEVYDENKYFPMHGQSCFNFFKPCEYFGTCELSNDVLVGVEPPEKVDNMKKYQFKFTLQELIQTQIEMQAMEGL